MGLFQFALPTFSKEEGKKTVPLPPSWKREEGRYKWRDGKTRGGRKVAYVVNLQEGNEDKNSISSLRERAAVFATSVKMAHEKSMYNYQLYVISNQGHSLNVDTNKSIVCNPSCREMFSLLGYTLVDLVDQEMVNLNQRQQPHITIEKKQNVIHDILTNTIVIHLSLNSFLLRSIDSVMDSFVKQDSTVSYNDAPNTVLRKRAQDKVFTLKSTSGMDAPMYIFTPKSHQASLSYLEFLNCLSFNVDQDDRTNVLPSVSSRERRDSWQPTLYPKIRSLLGSVVSRMNDEDDTVNFHGKQCRILDNSSEILDPCMFAAGSQKCSHEDIRKNALIASFASGRCFTPWECTRNASGDGCINNLSEKSTNGECQWLQSKWLKLAKSLQ